jgi:hypothetical protein
MANRFATRSQWSLDSAVYPASDYLVAIPDGFSGTSGVFPFKVSDGSTPASRLPYAPNSAYFVLTGSTGGSVDIANVPLPVTSTDLNLEATQQDVLTSLGQFQFDGLGNLKTTGTGGGGGAVDQGAAGVDPWLVDTGIVQPTTPADTQPISATALPLPTGAATAAKQDTGNTSLASIDSKLTNPLPVSIPGAIAVTGPLTDAELRATPVDVTGTVTVTPPTLTKGTQGATGFSVQDLRDAGRTTANYYTNGAAAAGATSTETAITLTESLGTSSTSTGTSFTPPSGKTFRITAITLRCTGNATATAQTTVFTLRINTAGAVSTSSTPAIQRWALATPATSLAIDRITLSFPEGIDIFGNGTLQWGLTAQSTYTTNAPNWHANISGYLF